MDNRNDITGLIEMYKGWIAKNDEKIKGANEKIKGFEAQLAAGDDPDTLITIQEKEAEIADLETEVNVLQKTTDAAKAALDAAMAEDAPAE